MKRKIVYKIVYISITLALIVSAFFIGKAQSETPSKYDYLDLNTVTDTQIENDEVIVNTSTGDYYSFSIDK